MEKKNLTQIIEENAGRRSVFLPIVIALIAYLATISILEMGIHSASSDELVHLPAGVTYLKTRDFRMNPQHPPLVKIIAAAPVMFLNPELDLAHPAWQLESFDQWIVGFDFMYRNGADRLLFWGRMPILVLSLFLALFVFVWARQLYGISAGLIALFLYCFSPDVIAHSHFVTMDLPLSLFFLLTLFFTWKWLKNYRMRDYILAGISLGCALATKYSAVVLLLAIPVILLIMSLKGSLSGEEGVLLSAEKKKHHEKKGKIIGTLLQPLRHEEPMTRILAAALSFFLLAVIAFIVVQASYFFAPDLAIYFQGMRQVNIDHAPDFHYYLFGEFKKGGWWYYFPLALLVKTPIPFLVLFVIAIFSLVSYGSRFFQDEIFLFLPSLGLMLMTMALADNIGVRYLLPIFPMLFIFSARIVLFRTKEWLKYGVIAVLGIWYLIASVVIYPDHLAYFNECAGGPANGYKYLDDSNLEWGQDFRRMTEYIKENDIRDAWFLTWPQPWPIGTQSYYGVPAKNIDTEGVDALLGKAPEPGTYFISMHYLVRLKLHAQRTGNSYFDWLHLYDPVDRIGYSFLVYRFE